MEEIYYGSIQTPMGEIQGKIMFKTTGNKLEGYIETKGMKNYFTNGKVEKNHYVFSGSGRASQETALFRKHFLSIRKN